MRNIIKYCLGIILFLSIFSIKTKAIYDPLAVPNNKYGIHIADLNDIPHVPPLVNSSGGDWGYITLVITDQDRDVDKWDRLFSQMRKLHLIPLLRLATHVEGSSWKAPSFKDIEEWVSFLSRLSNWPTINRYIIAFNEPNQAKEWGNILDPEAYANLLVQLSQKLKEKSDQFFVLPAGLDASAPTGNDTLDEVVFLSRMFKAVPNLGDYIDGWTSHSYPNPAFSGSPFASGKGTLRTYEWELAYLNNLGITKKLPVFITETGWAHSGNGGRNLLPPETIATYIDIASMAVWKDERIVAVTPFLYQYPEPLFSMFSWLTGNKNPYPFYNTYKALAKTKGLPLLPPTEEYIALLKLPLSL